MADSKTVLAHMIPSNQTEVGATKALAYILNKSRVARGALNSLVQNTIGSSLEPVESIRVEVSYKVTNEEEGGEEGGRLDFVGYDRDGKNRIIGESKFGAALSPGQGRGYLGQLADGVSVLLFVVPTYKIEYLWGNVLSDVVKDGDEQERLEPIEAPRNIRCAKEKDTDRYLMMVSWRNLLQEMHDGAATEPMVQEDIRQLQGVTEAMDVDEILPLGPNDLGPEVGNRMRDVRRIFDEVVLRWRDVEWASIEGYGTSGQPQTGYGRFLNFAGHNAWFGVYYDLWGREDCENTPFWVQLYGLNWEFPATIKEIDRGLNLKMVENAYVPIHLQHGVIGEAIVDHIIYQLERIAQAIEEATEDQPA